MQAAAAPSPAFPAFADLPLELREQVWRGALPVGPGPPTLFPYVEGSWVRGSWSPGDRFYDELDGHGTWRLVTPPAPDVPVRTPLLDVDREARRVAVAWARERGYAIKRRGGGGGAPTTTIACAGYTVDIPGSLVIARPVDPSHDAICFPTAEASRNFIIAPWNFGPTAGNAEVPDFPFDSPLTAIALPRALFDGNNSNLVCGLFLSQIHLRLLYVILNPPPDVIGLGSWELRSNAIYGPGSFFWDYARRVFVYPKLELSEAGKDMYKVAHAIAESLTAKGCFRSIFRDPADFEVRFAHMVKR